MELLNEQYEELKDKATELNNKIKRKKDEIRLYQEEKQLEEDEFIKLLLLHPEGMKLKEKLSDGDWIQSNVAIMTDRVAEVFISDNPYINDSNSNLIAEVLFDTGKNKSVLVLNSIYNTKLNPEYKVQLINESRTPNLNEIVDRLVEIISEGNSIATVYIEKEKYKLKINTRFNFT